MGCRGGALNCFGSLLSVAAVFDCDSEPSVDLGARGNGSGIIAGDGGVAVTPQDGLDGEWLRLVIVRARGLG